MQRIQWRLCCSPPLGHTYNVAGRIGIQSRLITSTQRDRYPPLLSYEGLCVVCGCVFHSDIRTQKFCSIECNGKSQRKTNRPSKEELSHQLQKSNFTKLGKVYNVSDNAIRQWCRSYGLSDKACDYK